MKKFCCLLYQQCDNISIEKYNDKGIFNLVFFNHFFFGFSLQKN